MSNSKVKISAAIEHVHWCAQHQGDGYIPIRILRTSDSGEHTVDDTRWFHNRDPRLAKNLRGFLTRYARERVTVLYSPCAFSKKQAKAQHALPNQIAYVDADDGRSNKFRPEPTRIVKSSELGEHWFWLLSRPLPADELQALNKALTLKIRADAGGHSPAKLFRLPGFHNFKHEPAYRVAVFDDTGEIHDTNSLSAIADSGARRKAGNVIDISSAVASSRHLRPESVIEKYWQKLRSNSRGRLRQRSICGPMGVMRNGLRVSAYPGDDRSEIVWGLALDLRRVGATSAETLAVVTNTIFWKARERDGKAEDATRFIDRLFDVDLEDDDQVETKTLHDFSSALNAVDPATWEGLPVPTRKWIIENWIPWLKVTLLYGDGGTGKTLLALMLAVAVALGRDFLGLKVTQGRVYALLGENDDADTHMSMVDICRHHGVGLGDLEGRVRLASRSGFDNVLMHFEKGTGKHTELFRQLLSDVTEFDADLIILETAADLFGGNENVRSEVRQFIANCCEIIAKEAKAAVFLCAHPSVTGLRSGDGTAGSTAWNNSARSRLYLRREFDEHGTEPDPDFRVLSRLKANFAPRQDSIDCVWRDGVFVVNDPLSDRPAVTDLDRRVVGEVARAFDAGEAWSAHHQAGHRYLVPWISKNLKQTRRAAKAMVGRLMADKSIVEIVTDAHTHRKGLCTPEQAAKHPRDKKAK